MPWEDSSLELVSSSSIEVVDASSFSLDVLESSSASMLSGICLETAADDPSIHPKLFEDSARAREF